MIDPHNVSIFDRDKHQLEEWWLFSILLAGKSARTIARQLDNFLNDFKFKNETPLGTFVRVFKEDDGVAALKKHGFGQQKRIIQAVLDSQNIDLFNASVDDLEQVRGVGRKTSRMFLMHSREGFEGATHILKYLRALGYVNAPMVTPTQKKLYLEYEGYFVERARQLGVTSHYMDIQVWTHYEGSKPAVLQLFDQAAA